MSVWGLVFLAAAAPWSATSRAAPLEVYGKLPFVEPIAISPNGAVLAMAVTNGEIAASCASTPTR
jgi:hypothetical protein